MSFDAIVIGSGFGGAITGCRLAEAGYRVLILERGQRWDDTNFPRQPEDMWLWNHDHPEREHGWLDLANSQYGRCSRSWRWRGVADLCEHLL